MKIRVKYIVVGGGLIFGILSTQCERCIENQLPSQSFTQQELALVPYQINDTLHFKNTENTCHHIYYITNRKTDYYKFMEQIPAGHNHYCSGNYYYSQYCNISFNSYHCSIQLSISNILHYWYYDSLYKYITFNFMIPSEPHSLFFYGEYIIKDDTLLAGRNGINRYYNSISIGPKTYQNVYELQGDTIHANVDDYLVIGYYSIERGLVGFKSNHGAYWFLE